MISYDGAFSNTSRTIPSFSSALTSWNPKLAVAGTVLRQPDGRRAAQASGPDLGRAPARRPGAASQRARGGCVEEPTRGAQPLTLRSEIALGCAARVRLASLPRIPEEYPLALVALINKSRLSELSKRTNRCHPPAPRPSHCVASDGSTFRNDDGRVVSYAAASSASSARRPISSKSDFPHSTVALIASLGC